MAKRCCGTASDTGEVVAVGSGHALDHTDVAQPAKLARETGRRELFDQRQQVGTPDTGDVHPWVLQGVQQRAVERIKEVDPLHGLVLDPARLGEPVERANASREVVEGRQMLQIAAGWTTNETHCARLRAKNSFFSGGASPVGGGLIVAAPA